MTWLTETLAFVRDRVIVALSDVERGDHYQAAEALEQAAEKVADAIRRLRKEAA